MKNIVVLTSGGDAPGMNAAVRAIVRTGHHYGFQVFGSQSGFQGIVNQTLLPLRPEDVANCIQHGGTILKTDRCLGFYDKKTRDKCRQFLKDNEIAGLIVVGGNGSFKGARILEEEGGPQVIGIPATIDNDVPGSEYSIGFDTARNTALSAIDKIRDTASSHNRNFLVEVMGRDAGFLAVDVGIAGGAEFILIPEIDTSIEKLANKILKPRRAKSSSIIVVAEAANPGRSVAIASELKIITQLPFRVCILGHTQRGGSPTTLDRKLASEMGYLAVKYIKEGHSQKMITFHNNSLTLKPFPAMDSPPRTFEYHELLKMNDILCS